MRGLAGKVCIVAGGATGLGRATVMRLAEEGAKVVAGDIDLERAKDTAAQAAASGKSCGGTAVAVAFDMLDETSIAGLVKAAVDIYGGVDAIHINAYAPSLKPDTDALETSLETFDHIINQTLRAYLVCTRYALPEILKRGGGSICYTSSGSAFMGEPIRMSYAMAKVGLTALTRHVARRWGKQGVRANTILPGMVLTEIVLKRIAPEERAAALTGHASHRLGRPEDIAAMVAMLFSEDGSWITGQSLSVDGGVLMR